MATIVKIVSAKDPDQGGQEEVVFSIDRRSDPGRHFWIDQAGRVIVQRELDREKNPLYRVSVTFIQHRDVN